MFTFAANKCYNMQVLALFLIATVILTLLRYFMFFSLRRLLFLRHLMFSVISYLAAMLCY